MLPTLGSCPAHSQGGAFGGHPTGEARKIRKGEASFTFLTFGEDEGTTESKVPEGTCELRVHGVLGNSARACTTFLRAMPAEAPGGFSRVAVHNRVHPGEYHAWAAFVARTQLVLDPRFEGRASSGRPACRSSARNSPFSSRSRSSGDGFRDLRSTCKAATSALANFHLRVTNNSESTRSVRLSKSFALSASPGSGRRGSGRSMGSVSTASLPRSVFFAHMKALRPRFGHR